MKKFLSILLALAVGFTFTFGSAMSAFAASATDDQAKLLTDAYTYAQGQVNTYFDKAYDSVVKEGKIRTYPVEKAAWDALTIKADLDKELSKTVDTQAKNYSATGATYKAVAEDIFKYGTTGALVGATVDTEAKITAWIHEFYDVKAALNQYNSEIEEAKETFDKVDYSLYSKTTPVGETSYYEQAVAKVAEGKIAARDKADSDAFKFDAKTFTVDRVAFLADTVKSYKAATVDAYLTEITFTVNGTTYGTGNYKVKSVMTTEDEANADLDNKATAAKVKAEVQANYVNYMKSADADKEFATAYSTIYNYLADEGIITTTAEVKAFSALTAKDVKEAIDTVESLKVFAAKYSAEKDANGTLVRDAAEINKIVERATKAIYATAVDANYTDKSYSAAKAMEDIIKLTTEGTASDLAFAKEVKKAALQQTKTDAADNETYYPAELEKYNAAVDAAIAKVDAAKTVTEVNTVKIDTFGITEAKDVDKMFTTGKLSSEFTTQKAALKNYIDNVKNYGKTVLDPTYLDVKDLEGKLIEFYGNKGARSVAEMKALEADAKAMIDGLATKGQLNDAKTAAETAIKAIPAKVTSADRATVEAAWKALADYAELLGTEPKNATVDNKADLNAAIADLYKALNYDMMVKVANVDKNDKAALNTLLDEFTALNDLTEADQIFEGKAFNDAAVKNALKTIRNNELKAVNDAIKALPVNITAADADKVKAARDAYDAFVKEYTDYVGEGINAAPYNAAGQLKANYSALVLAEATLATIIDAGKLTAEEAKAYVQDLAIAVRTAKVGKKVKVTVNADVQTLIDNGYTVTYKFYKSTKKGSGYKNTVNKTANTYTNTNPVKGKNYYKVKLVVKNADGAVVATTPLTQCKYGVRTIK